MQLQTYTIFLTKKIEECAQERVLQERFCYYCIVVKEAEEHPSLIFFTCLKDEKKEIHFCGDNLLVGWFVDSGGLTDKGRNAEVVLRTRFSTVS